MNIEELRINTAIPSHYLSENHLPILSLKFPQSLGPAYRPA